MPRKVAPDMWLFGVAVVLLSAGVVMVYSASAIVAADRFRDPYFFLKKQLFWALLGAVAMLAAVRVDYRRLEKLVVPALIVAGVLLVLVLLPPLLVAGAFAALVFVQPDLGNCLTLVTLTFGLLYLAGSPARYLGWALA